MHRIVVIETQIIRIWPWYISVEGLTILKTEVSSENLWEGVHFINTHMSNFLTKQQTFKNIFLS